MKNNIVVIDLDGEMMPSKYAEMVGVTNQNVNHWMDREQIPFRYIDDLKLTLVIVPEKKSGNTLTIDTSKEMIPSQYAKMMNTSNQNVNHWISKGRVKHRRIEELNMVLVQVGSEDDRLKTKYATELKNHMEENMVLINQ